MFFVVRENQVKARQSEDDAIQEATRLCQKENAAFYVVQTMKRISRAAAPVTVEDATAMDASKQSNHQESDVPL